MLPRLKLNFKIGLVIPSIGKSVRRRHLCDAMSIVTLKQPDLSCINRMNC